MHIHTEQDSRDTKNKQTKKTPSFVCFFISNVFPPDVCRINFDLTSALLYITVLFIVVAVILFICLRLM